MSPLIGITADHQKERHSVGIAYAKAVVQAGGIPIILPPLSGMESHYVTICDGFVFSGGDDPIMEEWGVATHPKACLVSPLRQTFELTLLEQLQTLPEIPVLGVCLGMQWMGLLASGNLEQHVAPTLAKNHKEGLHRVFGDLGDGMVYSHHHQALIDAGTLDVVATSEDGVIEAVQNRSRAWYVGVQWHPERTNDAALGQGLFTQLVEASKAKRIITQ